MVVINNLNKEKLILTLLKKKSIQFELEKKNGLIGREPKESDLFIQLKNDKVSRIHAEIVYNEYGYYIRDKKSANGTFISLPYKKDWILKEGMKFEAGSNEYQISKILNDTIEFNCTEGELLNEKYYLSVPTNKSDFTSIGKSVSNYLKINDEDLEDEHIKIYKNEKNNVIMTPMNEKSE